MKRRLGFALSICVVTIANAEVGAESQSATRKPPIVAAEQIGAVRSFQSLSTSTGWILTDRQVLWTSDDGNTWEDVTPVISSTESVDTALFLDESRGWVFLSDRRGPLGTAFSIATTTDSGGTWSRSPVAPDDEMLRSGYGAAASLSFPDTKHGWVLIRCASSSAQSIGSLYTTTDGGNNWAALPTPPIGGNIRFISAQDGWIAGGVRDMELYVTHDGGHRWTLQTVDAPQNLGTTIRARYKLPTFGDAVNGAMPVEFETGKRLTFATYSTADGGQSWRLRHVSYNIPASMHLGVASSRGRAIAALSRGGSVTLSGDIATHSPAALPALPESASIRDIQFVDNAHAWALTSGVQCAAPKSNCVTYTSLLKTLDGGGTFLPLLQHSETPSAGAPVQPPDLIDGSGPNPADHWADLDALTPAVFVPPDNLGVDTCDNYYYNIMQQLWNTSANTVFGFYLGGQTAMAPNIDCNISDAFDVNALSCQGWSLLPIYDDLQAPCFQGQNSVKMSSDPGTAAAQGAATAVNAKNALVAAGLWDGIIYEDLDHYPTGDAACSAAVKAYVNAYVAGMHAFGYAGALYVSGDNLAADLIPGQIANFPDVVWIPQYPGPGYAIEPLYKIDDPPQGFYYWIYNQRIHQVWGDQPTGYEYPPYVLDSDFIDGPVSVLDVPYCPECDVCDDTCPNYNPNDPSCQDQGTDEACITDPIYGVLCDCWSEDGYDCCCKTCGVCEDWNGELSSQSAAPVRSGVAAVGRSNREKERP